MQQFVTLALSPRGGRAVARLLKTLAWLLPNGRFPSANGGQWWLLRIGLYELRRPREQADDWVWMIDHTIQTGQGKCFVVFAFRLSVWRRKIDESLARDPDSVPSLEHRDLSVWMIERVESSSGEVVREPLERWSRETGVEPCGVLSDQGADVRHGGEKFSSVADRQTVLLHDISHAVANALKRQLAQCPHWAKFLADANHSQTKLRQTHGAFLMPPELKAKARWMNLEPLVAWSQRVLTFLDHPQAGLERAESSLTPEQLAEKMGWLREHSEAIQHWTTLMQAASTTLNVVRVNGDHESTPEVLRERLAKFTNGPARALCDEVEAFVRTQSLLARDQRLPGSTEILESLIGKGKQLTGSTRNGFTKSLLALAATVSDLTTQTIEAALNSTPVRDVQTWITDNLGLSLQSQKQRAFAPITTGTKPE